MISKTDILPILAEIRAFFASAHENFTGLAEILKTTENWWAAIAVYFGIIKNAYVRIRDTSISFFVTKNNWKHYFALKKIRLSKKIHYLGGDRFRFSHLNGLEFNCDNNELPLVGHAAKMDCYYNESNNVVCEVAGLKFITPFPHGTYELKEIFIDRMYGEPCCNNAVVVDIGAFIGDSPLFFASRGAKLVVAFEPVPALFDILKKNIALNGFEKVIQARNYAVSNNFGTINIGYIPARPGSSSESPLEEALFFTVTTTPLSEIIMSLERIDILKIDCEGCEQKVLTNAVRSGALKRVGTIIIEVHSEVCKIINLLKNEGFKIIKLRKGKGVWILTARRNEQYA